MAYQYTGRKVLIDSASTSTSDPYLVADFRLISLSWQSRASLGPSRITVEGSNADGLQVADLGGSTSAVNWSLVTGINIIGRPTGMETLEPGYRWIRATVAPANHSAASATSVALVGKSW